MTTWLIHLLLTYLERSGEAVVDSELRHGYDGEEWVFLPDVSVTLKQRLPYPPADTPKGPFEILPDLAIEVVSPDDQPGRLQRRIGHYMRSGVPLLWVVDPEVESVTVWEPGKAPLEMRAPSVLNAQPVLSAFELDLETLFARLHD
jgi:Uma2 family endonuclease